MNPHEKGVKKIQEEDKITMAAARVNRKLTQLDVAKAMNVSQYTVHNWETGKVVPKPAQFEMFARICKRSPEKIYLPEKST